MLSNIIGGSKSYLIGSKPLFAKHFGNFMSFFSLVFWCSIQSEVKKIILIDLREVRLSHQSYCSFLDFFPK